MFRGLMFRGLLFRGLSFRQQYTKSPAAPRMHHSKSKSFRPTRNFCSSATRANIDTADAPEPETPDPSQPALGVRPESHQAPPPPACETRAGPQRCGWAWVRAPGPSHTPSRPLRLSRRVCATRRLRDLSMRRGVHERAGAPVPRRHLRQPASHHQPDGHPPERMLAGRRRGDVRARRLQGGGAGAPHAGD